MGPQDVSPYPRLTAAIQVTLCSVVRIDARLMPGFRLCGDQITVLTVVAWRFVGGPSRSSGGAAVTLTLRQISGGGRKL